MKTKLDRYSLLIISKYFRTYDDFINAMLTNKKFEELVDMFHFNPIPIDNSSKKLFLNIETQHIYSRYDEIIPNLFKYIVWYPSDISTISYFDKRYHLRPIFKQLYVDYSFLESENKNEGDSLIISDFEKGNNDFIGYLDCSEFVGMRGSTFYYSLIREIKLGKHINTIPYNCFYNCSLINVDLTNVTKIEESFQQCNLLTSITLSNHLEVMDINCFRGCSSLETITISDNSKEFGFDLSYELYQIMKSNGIQCTGNIWITDEDNEKPTEINGKFVTKNEIFNKEIIYFDSFRIPSYWFNSDLISNIKQIVLSSNVVSLGSYALIALKSLESINLENVKKISQRCFQCCVKLKEVNISNITSLKISAFYGCDNLTSVTYSSNLNYIPPKCFEKCKKLKEIKGIENVHHIYFNCLKGCNKLKVSVLPKNLIKIGSLNGKRFNIKSIDEDCSISCFKESCFKGNTTLEYIHMKKSDFMKKIIGPKAFSFCTSLKEVKLEGISNLNDESFRDCYLLSTIIFPSTLKAIGKYCFENCWSLKEIEIPSSVKCIKECAFLSCKSLTKVEFGSEKVKILFDTFKDCPLREINLLNGNKLKGWFNYEHYLILKSKGIDVKKVEYTRSDRRKYGNKIPECCSRIDNKTFEGCSMKELTIPSNIKSFGYKCFYKCRNLNKIYMSSELKNKVRIDINYRHYDNYFIVSINFIQTNYVLLFEEVQKDETIPIEIIEI